MENYRLFPYPQLTQHMAIEQLFSNVTWTNLPPADLAFQELPEDSEEYQIVRQWGQPNIFVTLILYFIVHVSWCVLWLSFA